MKKLFKNILFLIMIFTSMILTGCGDDSNNGGNDAPAVVPASPGAATVTAADSQLSLAWSAVEGATAYEVWYNTIDDSSTSTQSGGDINVTVHTITGLTNNTVYYVWLKAKNAAGTSDFGPVATGMPVISLVVPSTPGEATITAEDSQLSLTWIAVEGATAYEVWYNTVNDSSSAIQSGDDINITAYTITGLINDTVYYVWLKAKNAMGTSDFGPVATGMPNTHDKGMLEEIKPRPDSFTPLKSKKFTTIGKQVEIMLFGARYKESGDIGSNQTIIDPNNVEMDDDIWNNQPVAPENEVLDARVNDQIIGTDKKITLTGALDNDPFEEVILLTYDPIAGPATLILVDSSENAEGQLIVENIVISADLSIEGADETTPYSYDLEIADIDGDGFDEILVAGVADLSENKYGYLWILDDKENNYAQLFFYEIKGIFSITVGYPGVDNIAVSCGNFDLDTANEIVLVYGTEEDYGNLGGDGKLSYEILDDADSSFTQLLQEKTENQLLESKNFIFDAPYDSFPVIIDVICANVDDDAYDEVMIASHDNFISGTYQEIFTNEPVIFTFPDSINFFHSKMEIHDIEILTDTSVITNTTLHFININFPEYEPEIIQHVEIIGGGIVHVTIYINSISFYKWLDRYNIVLKAGNFDGAKGDEIYFDLNFYQNARASIPFSTWEAGGYPDAYSDLFPPADFPDRDAVVNDLPDYVFPAQLVKAAAGDVNGDLRDDLIFIGRDPADGSLSIYTYGYVDNFEWPGGVKTYVGTSWQAISIHDSMTDYNPDYFYDLATPNVDNDSIVIEGEPEDFEIEELHTVYYSNNQIITVLAAPPLDSAISSQNIDNSGTAIGETTNAGFSLGTEMSIRAGILVGVKGSITAGVFVQTEIASWEAELSAEVEASLSSQASFSVEKTVTQSSCGLEELVIFTTTPYDRYTYVIASHPNPLLKGSSIFIDIPQEPKVLAVTREYYNEHNGDQMDIDENILPYTPGIPSSYPGPARRDEILSNTNLPLPAAFDFFSFIPTNFIDSIAMDGPFEINQGSGTTEAEITISTGVGFEAGISLNVNAMAKACAGDICTGRTGGFSLGSNMGTDITASTTFKGTVGAISDYDEFNANNYEWGIFAYRQKIEDDDSKIMHNFIVVNYWVE